jgi:hypothetical protein
MFEAILFWIFFVSSLLLIGWHGDFFARGFALFLAAMTILTFVLNMALGMEAAWKWVVLIHIAILIAALVGVMINDCFWPIWFAGFQLNSVGASLAQLVDSDSYLGLYAYSASIWALPALCAAVIGVMRDSQRRRRAPETAGKDIV